MSKMTPLDNADTVLYVSPEATRQAHGLSLRTCFASLVTAASIFAIQICLFVLLKDRLKQIYQPRTYLVPEEQRTTQRPLGTISWIPQSFQIPDRVFLQNSGLDAFFFLRYVHTVFNIFVGLSVIVLPILIPLNYYGSDHITQNQGLDKFSWENISINNTKLYWAHLVIALIVIVFTCHILYTELVFYVHVRQIYLRSPGHCLLDSANTILVTDIPERDLFTLERIYSIYPGGVRSVWINRDLSGLTAKLKARRNLVIALEAAETNLIRSAAASARQTKSCWFVEQAPTWKRYLNEKNRDHIYLPIYGWTWMPAIPLLGKRVDTIYHCLKELELLNRQIQIEQTELAKLNSDQRQSRKYPLIKSAFVQFNTQSAAYMACQTLVNQNPLYMSTRDVDVSVHDIRWDSLAIQWWNRYSRIGLVWFVICFLLLTWAVPVAFTGFLSQITTFSESMSWLHWIGSAPAWLSGSLQGVLPQLVLVVLTTMLPLILRTVTSWQGLLTETALELTVQKYHFIFLFVQNFLTVALSSSSTAIAQEVLQGLDSAPRLLARNLPKASNYFFSYIILQGLSVSAGALLQIDGLINWLFVAPWMDRTPRQKRERLMTLPEIRWGTCYPLYTTLACIGESFASILMAPAYNLGLTYAIISPLILVFSFVSFGLFLLVFRYNLLYVSASRYDTGGRFYPTALKQLFTGIYMMELCLLGLFSSIRDNRGKITGIGQAVIMMIATIATVIYQFLIANAFASILDYLPASARDMQEDGRERSFLSKLNYLLNSAYGWIPPSKVPLDFQESIHKFSQGKLDGNQQGYHQHDAADFECPMIWIPKDEYGISEGEIAFAEGCGVKISNELARLDSKGRLEISSV